MRIDILTIFPDFFRALDLSLLGKAQDKGTLDIAVHNLRDWTSDRHHTVDDSPYGGGPGMVMKVDVWARAVDQVLTLSNPKTTTAHSRRIVMVPTPSGKQFNQSLAQELSTADQLIFACGRYEGIDARFVQRMSDIAEVEVCEFSLGDYVLNGGESATLVAVEAIGRLVPDVIGNSSSLEEESHGKSGLLEYPVYTRPVTFEGMTVPKVLLTGNHESVAQWRHNQALRRTVDMRPDLLQPGGKAHPHLSASDRETVLYLGLSPDGGAVKTSVSEYAGGHCIQISHQRGRLSRSAAAVVWPLRQAHPDYPHEFLQSGYVIIGARPDLGPENEIVSVSVLHALTWARENGAGLALMRASRDSAVQKWCKERNWRKVSPGLWKVLRHADLDIPGKTEPDTTWMMYRL